MKFFKKFLAIFLCAIMIACIAPLSFIEVKAENTTYYDGVWAYQVEDGYAVLVGVSEPQYGEVCGPPSVLGGYPLRVISGVNCMVAGIHTKQFIIPQGVEKITQGAFNTGLFESVVMPKSLKYIDFNAFPNCWGFTTIYYEGTESDWANIHIEFPGLSNAPVVNATKHYGYVYENDHQKFTIYGREFNKNIDYFTTFLNSSEYDPVLSNMLAALSAAAYDKGKIQAAYEALGFVDMEINGYSTFDSERCSYAIGFKDSENSDEKICVITFRGSGSDSLSDWLGNVNINTYENKHQGFLDPAVLVRNKILERYGTSDNVKYVITGHSRGAAVGNLLAVELMEEGINANNIYNYNFACPDVACLKEPPVPYDNIFNLCNTEDPVPYLPGEICNTFTNDDGALWCKYGRNYWYSYEDEKISPFSNHSIDLYLEFLDQSEKYSEYSKFPYSRSSDFALWFAKILCPVDVFITDEERNQVVSVINGEVIYYDSSIEGLILVFTDGDKKVVYISEDASFNVDLIGTDDGSMTFTLGKYDLATGEVSESKTFNNVVLEEGKTMYSSVSASSEISDVELFVVEEKDGEQTITHTINTDGTESSVETDTSIEPDTSAPSTDKEDSNESESTDQTPKDGHSSCRANWWTRLWRNIFNALRRIFGLPEKCVCGELLN